MMLKKTNEEPANEGKRNGQEKERGASNKEDDQNVQDFRAELDNLLVQQKEDDEDSGADADLNQKSTTRIQDKYVADILKKFDFVTIKISSTPIETNKALLKDEEAEDVDVHLYRSMIGSLMYLTDSRPDIMFAVCDCARDSPFDLEAFSDSDYARASLDRKSTTGELMLIVGLEDSIRDKYGNKLVVVSKAKHIEYMKCVKSQTPRQAKRGRDTKIPQSGGPPEKVGDEAVH
ncbi:hypothetical protein Tco_0510702 [Tanacetum coccineum]